MDQPQPQSQAAETVQMIMRQTTYTEEQASAKLALYKNDVYKVLRDFMSIPEKKEQKPPSLNQTIYKELRTNLGVVDVDFAMNLASKG